MNLLKELKEEKIEVSKCEANVKCRVFEDNSGARTIANVQKCRPRTKHINKY